MTEPPKEVSSVMSAVTGTSDLSSSWLRPEGSCHTRHLLARNALIGRLIQVTLRTFFVVPHGGHQENAAVLRHTGVRFPVDTGLLQLLLHAAHRSSAASLWTESGATHGDAASVDGSSSSSSSTTRRCRQRCGSVREGDPRPSLYEALRPTTTGAGRRLEEGVGVSLASPLRVQHPAVRVHRGDFRRGQAETQQGHVRPEPREGAGSRSYGGLRERLEQHEERSQVDNHAGGRGLAQGIHQEGSPLLVGVLDGTQPAAPASTGRGEEAVVRGGAEAREGDAHCVGGGGVGFQEHHARGAGAPPGGDVSRASHVPDGGFRHEKVAKGATHPVAVLCPDRGQHRLPVGRSARDQDPQIPSGGGIAPRGVRHASGRRSFALKRLALEGYGRWWHGIPNGRSSSHPKQEGTCSVIPDVLP